MMRHKPADRLRWNAHGRSVNPEKKVDPNGRRKASILKSSRMGAYKILDNDFHKTMGTLFDSSELGMLTVGSPRVALEISNQVFKS